MTPLECGIIFDGIPEGAISRKVGLIWGIPVERLSNLASIKFVLFGMDTDRPGVYFMNTQMHQVHESFLNTIGLEGNAVHDVITGVVGYDPRLVAPDGSLGLYYFWFRLSGHSFSVGERSYALLAASMPLLDDNLAFYLNNFQLQYSQSVLPLYRESRINLLFDEDIDPETRFLALNRGEGYGLLRLMDPDERPNPRDVVIYEAIPNELPRVAGIVTTVPQTPLSHVNLRAVQDGIPNAFIRGALDNSDINALLGSYVRYTVTGTGWDLRAATPAEVDAHYAASRPAAETDTATGPFGDSRSRPSARSASRTGPRSASRRRTWPCWGRWGFRQGPCPTGLRRRSISTTSS